MALASAAHSRVTVRSTAVQDSSITATTCASRRNVGEERPHGVTGTTCMPHPTQRRHGAGPLSVSRLVHEQAKRIGNHHQCAVFVNQDRQAYPGDSATIGPSAVTATAVGQHSQVRRSSAASAVCFQSRPKLANRRDMSPEP